MKRSLSLIVLAAICVLALAAVTSLSGCSAKAPDNDPTGSIDAPDPPPAVTGETATYTSGYVDMALTIPEGWQWEAVQRSGTTTEGIRFWKTDDKALDFELLCWRNGYGICGTGVISEELTLSGGQKVWQHTEESDDGLKAAEKNTDGSETQIIFTRKEKPRCLSCNFQKGKISGTFTALLLGGGDATSVECTLDVNGLGLFTKPEKLLNERLEMLRQTLGV